jgi:hypothetical protein
MEGLMNNDAKRYLVEALTGAAAIYDKELPAGAIAMWGQALTGTTKEQLQKAFNQHARRSRWMPKPADIIAIIEGRDEESVKSLEARAEMGFCLAVKAISSVGRYNTPDFDDPGVSRAIELMGGWPSFCDMTDRAEPFERKRFCELYSRAIANGDGPGQLSGISDRRRVVQIACGNGSVEQRLIAGTRPTLAAE